MRSRLTTSAPYQRQLSNAAELSTSRWFCCSVVFCSIDGIFISSRYRYCRHRYSSLQVTGWAVRVCWTERDYRSATMKVQRGFSDRKIVFTRIRVKRGLKSHKCITFTNKLWIVLNSHPLLIFNFLFDKYRHILQFSLTFCSNNLYSFSRERKIILI